MHSRLIGLVAPFATDRRFHIVATPALTGPEGSVGAVRNLRTGAARSCALCSGGDRGACQVDECGVVFRLHQHTSKRKTLPLSCVLTTSGLKILPLPYVFTAHRAKTMPWPCMFTASELKTLPLPYVITTSQT